MNESPNSHSEKIRVKTGEGDLRGYDVCNRVPFTCANVYIYILEHNLQSIMK